MCCTYTYFQISSSYLILLKQHFVIQSWKKIRTLVLGSTQTALRIVTMVYLPVPDIVLTIAVAGVVQRKHTCATPKTVQVIYNYNTHI